MLQILARRHIIGLILYQQSIGDNYEVEVIVKNIWFGYVRPYKRQRTEHVYCTIYVAQHLLKRIRREDSTENDRKQAWKAGDFNVFV